MSIQAIQNSSFIQNTNNQSTNPNGSLLNTALDILTNKNLLSFFSINAQNKNNLSEKLKASFEKIAKISLVVLSAYILLFHGIVAAFSMIAIGGLSYFLYHRTCVGQKNAIIQQYSSVAPLQQIEYLLALDRNYGIESQPFILANESSSLTHQTLAGIPKINNSVHLGFSGWFNYDIVVARNSSAMILNDINNPITEVHQITKRIILTTNNRFDFIRSFIQELQRNSARYFYPGSTEQDILNELNRPGSWLSTDWGFQKIQSLFRQNRVVLFRNDIKDQRNCQAIHQWIDHNSLCLDTCYISNIPDWLQEHEKQVMRNNLRIMQPQLMIDASLYYNREEPGKMAQRVYRI